jgi:hypothetical protein
MRASAPSLPEPRVQLPRTILDSVLRQRADAASSTANPTQSFAAEAPFSSGGGSGNCSSTAPIPASARSPRSSARATDASLPAFAAALIGRP